MSITAYSSSSSFFERAHMRFNSPEVMTKEQKGADWDAPEVQEQARHLDDFLKLSSAYFTMSDEEVAEASVDEKTRHALKFVEATSQYLEGVEDEAKMSYKLEWAGLTISGAALGVGVIADMVHPSVGQAIPYLLGAGGVWVAEQKVKSVQKDREEFSRIHEHVFKVFEHEKHDAQWKLDHIIQALHQAGYDEDNENLFSGYEADKNNSDTHYSGKTINTKLCLNGIMCAYNPNGLEKQGAFKKALTASKEALAASAKSMVRPDKWGAMLLYKGPKAAIELSPHWAKYVGECIKPKLQQAQRNVAVARAAVQDWGSYRYAEKGKPKPIDIPDPVEEHVKTQKRDRHKAHMRESFQLFAAAHCDAALLFNEAVSMANTLAQGVSPAGVVKATLHGVATALSFQPPEFFSEEVVKASEELKQREQDELVKRKSALSQRLSDAVAENPKRVDPVNDNGIIELDIPNADASEERQLAVG